MTSLFSNSTLTVFVAIVTFASILLFIAAILIINNSDFVARVLMPRRISVQVLEKQISTAVRRQGFLQENGSLFGREQLLRANITEDPAVFFARVILIFIVGAIILIVSLRPSFGILIALLIFYTIIFFFGYVIYLKYKQVKFEEEILRELPDVAYVLISALSKEKQATLLDALRELERNYPNMHITKAFKSTISALQRLQEPDKALIKSLRFITFPRFKELVGILMNYAQTNSYQTLTTVFNTFTQSIYSTIALVDEANTSINYYFIMMLLIISGVAVGIANSVSRLRNLVVNAGAYSTLNMMKMISLYIPIALVAFGVVVFVYLLVIMKQKILSV